jgi:hypothetical protein
MIGESRQTCIAAVLFHRPLVHQTGNAREDKADCSKLKWAANQRQDFLEHLPRDRHLGHRDSAHSYPLHPRSAISASIDRGMREQTPSRASSFARDKFYFLAAARSLSVATTPSVVLTSAAKARPKILTSASCSSRLVLATASSTTSGKGPSKTNFRHWDRTSPYFLANPRDRLAPRNHQYILAA